MNYTIYSKPGCAYCDKAKALLTTKGLAYTELVLDVGQPNEAGNPLIPLSEFKAANPTVKTLPYILANTAEGVVVVGGFTELVKFLG
jgi:glutaredoxin